MDGRFVVLASAPPGRVCVLEASTGLVSWTPVQTNTVPAGGQVELTDETSGTHRLRFYRVKCP